VENFLVFTHINNNDKAHWNVYKIISNKDEHCRAKNAHIKEFMIFPLLKEVLLINSIVSI
jgi:hypothetical protein